jgi:hypothetical protein
VYDARGGRELNGPGDVVEQVKAWVRMYAPLVIIAGVIFCGIMGYVIYTQFRIDVPQANFAVLIHKTGKDIPNDSEVAPGPEYKGVQTELLSEGRYFYNPWNWDWTVQPMIEIGPGKMGVLIRLSGDNLGYGQFVAEKETQKGIVADVLRAGRYPINPWVYKVEKDHDPIIIPAGFRGVVTNLCGPMPADPNKILVEDGKRGVQSKTLSEGTYYLNPYMFRVCLIDCRSQRFTISEGARNAQNQSVVFELMGFPSKDGFLVTMDGVIEFRIKPEKAAEVYTVYNDAITNEDCARQVINKIILPSARAYCRIQGANNTGRDFISGATRQKFQAMFQDSMKKSCDPAGVEIIQALVTKINPPDAISDPIRKREVLKQQKTQFTQQILQQKSEVTLARQKAMIGQKTALVDAGKQVVTITTKAMQDQDVAKTLAEQKLAVAKTALEAAKDQASAIKARKEGEAKVITMGIEAEAEGWRQSVKAYNGDGDAYARYILYQKMAPAFQNMMVNTADSPLMEVFRNFQAQSKSPVTPMPAPAPAPVVKK